MKSIALSAVLFIVSVAQAGLADAQEFLGGNFMLQDALDAPKRYCLDLEGYAYITDLDAPVIVHSCKEGWFKDGTWMVDYPEPGQIYIPWYELCVAAGGLHEGADVVLQECSQASAQRFVFHDDGKVEAFSDAAEKFCLAVGETSRPTGNNLRRQTRMTNCEQTDASMTKWILPREGQTYPIVVAEPVEDADGAPAGPPVGRLFGGACAPCHGSRGEGYQSEYSPKLSGQEDWYLMRQLMNFRNDVRGAHPSERWAKQMSFHIKDFSPSRLNAFVEFIATLEDVPATATVEGDEYRGGQLYAQLCTACHGADGMGIAALNSPRLAGMSDWYMAIQLRKFREGVRGNEPADIYGAQMRPFALTLPDEQAILDVIAHINTLAVQ